MELKIVIFICISNFLFAKCIIPNLSVRKLDSRIIERKRQDNFEICRLFNEENKINQIINTTHKTNEHKNGRRIKRDIDNNGLGNPMLKHDDIVRVEKIVDKLYNDVDENGNQVPYRRRDLTDITKAKNPIEKINRRFNFAPAQLYGPLGKNEDIEKPLQSKSVKITWIKKWKHGIVPFFIDSNTYDSFLADTILKAFDYIQKVTCIRLQRLRERPTDKKSMQSVEWLYITNPSGIRQCVHSNERKPNTGVQMVVFGYDCLSQGEIAHEIMHILGFSHEHTRPDRDNYITILWDNIKSGYKKYFEIRKDDPLSNLPYDYASVLHYPPRAFSKNGQVTVMTVSDIKVGQREALSELDVEKVGMIYGLECVERNKDYLIKTCPSVVKIKDRKKEVVKDDIEKYFKDRIWPYGIINYKIKDAVEFTAEERDNIKAVLSHIEKETCIEFRDITAEDEDENDKGNKNNNPSNDPPSDGVGSGAVNKEPEDMEVVDNEVSDIKPGDAEAENKEVANTNHVDAEAVSNEAGNTNPLNAEASNDEGVETEPVDEEALNAEVIDPKPADAKVVAEQIDTEAVDDQAINVGPENKNIKLLGSNNTTSPLNLKLTLKKDRNITVQNYKKAKKYKRLLRHSKITIRQKNKPSIMKRVNKSNKGILRGTTRKVKITLHLPTARRHAANVIILKRSSEPGCKCPPAGRPNGNKILTINADCFNSVNDLLHVFVHVLGLDHQHNTHDRDSYLHILWENLTPEVKKEMEKKLPPAASAGFAYDYQSVMHYPWLQIKDGVTNIMYPVWNDGWAMGHWQGLSWTDVQKLNLIYGEECQKRNN